MQRPCPRCGSSKIVPDVPLIDCYGDSGHHSSNAEVAVHGDPKAWFFRDTSTGQLLLRICGDCGYAELQVGNFRELYEKYVKSVKSQIS